MPEKDDKQVIMDMDDEIKDLEVRLAGRDEQIQSLQSRLTGLIEKEAKYKELLDRLKLELTEQTTKLAETLYVLKKINETLS